MKPEVDRRWIPAEWLDEVVPTCGKSPDAFLKRHGDVLKLAPLDDLDPEDWPQPEALSDGQIVLFCWTEQYGDWTVKVADDGSFTFPEGTPPETATHFSFEDEMEDSPAQLVRLLLDNAGIERGGEFEMYCYAWSDPLPYRLKILESGAAHFEAAEQIGEPRARELIEVERNRQVIEEGWSAAHDDAHDGGQLLAAARCYLDASDDPFSYEGMPPASWPWEVHWWKPKSQRLDLVRAGALCLAERDRLTRARATDFAEVEQVFGIIVDRLGRVVA